jgi:hypothetical protein
MINAFAIAGELLAFAYLCLCAAMVLNLGGFTDWIASRDMSRTIYRRNNSPRAWKLAGLIGFAVGLIAALALLPAAAQTS